MCFYEILPCYWCKCVRTDKRKPVSFRAICIFVMCYLVIIAGEHSPRKLDRPAVGLLGGVFMVTFGVLSRQEALHAIDFPTIVLLLGMIDRKSTRLNSS